MATLDDIRIVGVSSVYATAFVSSGITCTGGEFIRSTDMIPDDKVWSLSLKINGCHIYTRECSVKRPMGWHMLRIRTRISQT